ncbi:small acid-soluble spore protein alpha/beta type [Fictibacillus macauensis ZFHKF-1]|uniref:Small acid-soluble spore protein alpha/beta type n=1 Tax=Fictibacillus macauensis ZFHKF-1 TaxID=1196324 RepID=I8ADM4_9BACL|nr:alpha/beta-type small acid-soluble spore protein [Fictibacillus macauensis]EIT83652.1 small acid-soluble spore protein alpha/beta type [Fictibacillus macauensis ZFHKF-1]
MGRRRGPLVPEAREALDQLKAKVMREAGYTGMPDTVKFEVAKEVKVPLKEGYNGTLTAREAGTVGGQIGGRMVSELIRQAKEQLNKKYH